MRILLMSDSHLSSGLNEVLLAENCELNLHMGDSQFIKNNKELSNFDYIVRGNCDFERFPDHEIVNIAGKPWVLIHGHQVYNTHNLEELAIYAKDFSCEVICYGHTHIPMYSKVGGITILNPGSFARSRSYEPNSYMVVEIENGRWKVELKSARNRKVIKELKVNE